jgi:hypothetical protein
MAVQVVWTTFQNWHMLIVRFLMNSGEVFNLQKILEQTSLMVTRKYVNLASGDVEEIHRRFSPMDYLNFRVNKRERSRLMPLGVEILAIFNSLLLPAFDLLK